MDSSIRRIPPDAAASTSRVRPTRRRIDEDRDGERDFAAELEERRKGTKREAASERKAEGEEDRGPSDHGGDEGGGGDGGDGETGGSLDVVA